MSTDHDGGPAYDAAIPENVRADIAVSPHARQRFHERTPEDCSLSLAEAWDRGEFVEHPSLIQADMARVYAHGDRWATVFTVVQNANTEVDAPYAVTTTLRVCSMTFEPTRRYFEGYGPHATPEYSRTGAGPGDYHGGGGR